MKITVENFYALLFFIPIFFALIFSAVRYGIFRRAMNESPAFRGGNFSRISFCFWSRTVCNFFCASFLILAAAKISWGVDLVPVQKTGTAISFVFDVSYSMEAKDGPNGISRLESSSFFAEELLSRLKGKSVSVVLAKGEGVVAVPLTEDFETVENLIANLSPRLMSAEGTSLGGGLRAALSSFPEQSAAANYIWLFTDCEETDSSLQAAISECAKFGVGVAIIGFGSERESEIFAGDGKTKIKTALRSGDVEKILGAVREKFFLQNKNSAEQILYVDAGEVGSATKLLKMIKPVSEEFGVSYEVQNVSHSDFFILLSAIFFMASFVLGELDAAGGRKKFLSGMQAVVVMIAFTSCSTRFSDGTKILNGTFDWTKRDYQGAVGNFFDASFSAENHGDGLAQLYAVYGLGTTYLMQGETDSAEMRFQQIFDEAPDKIKFDILYNLGIISHRKGNYQEAAEFFKRSLLIDETNADAKINLELSLRENSVQPQSVQENVPISESDGDTNLQNELYSIIREDEKKQWKSHQQNSQKSAADY